MGLRRVLPRPGTHIGIELRCAEGKFMSTFRALSVLSEIVQPIDDGLRLLPSDTILIERIRAPTDDRKEREQHCRLQRRTTHIADGLAMVQAAAPVFPK